MALAAALGASAAFRAEALPLPVVAVTASADDGNVAANAVDGSMATRWSSQGDGQWIRFDLGTSQSVGSANIAWYQGDQRRFSFDIQTSGDGASWTTVFAAQSSGTTTAFETYSVVATTARYVRVLGHGNSVSTWNSIAEVQLFAPTAGGTAGGLQFLVDPAAAVLSGSLKGARVALKWDRQAGAAYQVQASSNLVSWGSVGAPFTNSGAAQSWTEDTSTLSPAAWPRRFYRVKKLGEPQLPQLVADFTPSIASGVAPLSVQLTDRSSGTPVAWNWSFGDGTSSTAQNPSHVFSTPGSYTTMLTVRNSAGSTSSKSVPIQVAQPPTGGNLPAQVLNLTNWKLTLPVDTSHAGSPDEIKQPELATYTSADYFHVNATIDGVVFDAQCGGATTSGSGYPRSELREMTSGGGVQASWSTTSGTHTMEVTEAFTHLPVVKPHCVGAQIHNAADDVITVRLEGSHLFFDQNGANGPTMTTSYHLGDKFNVKWIVRNGGVECYYNGRYIYTYPASTSGCYFKAGAYTQSNTSKGDSPTAYGEVVVYGLTVTHQ